MLNTGGILSVTSEHFFKLFESCGVIWPVQESAAQEVTNAKNQGHGVVGGDWCIAPIQPSPLGQSETLSQAVSNQTARQGRTRPGHGIRGEDQRYD